MTLIIASTAAGGILLLVVLMHRYVLRGSPQVALLSGFLFGMALLAVAEITAGFHDHLGTNVWRPLLFESYGMLLDLLVIGVILGALFEWRLKRRDIQRFQDNIDDLRGWRSPLASHRIRGNILRLHRRRVTKIDLTRCYLLT